VFGSSHTVAVKPAPGGRKYVYECSCGARGYQTASSHRSAQLGREHKAKARKGK
jgi:hypothetical protein